MEILLFCFQIQGTVNNQLLHSKIWKFSDLKFRCYINLETHQKNPITSETGRWSTFEALSSTSQIVKYTGTLIPIIKNDCILFKNTINFLLTFIYMRSKISSVQLSWSVMSDSLRTHEPQHTRPPCPRPSPTPGVYPNSCPLSWWCHPTISSSVIPFSPCLQSFPTSGSFQMSQLFASGSQNIGVSASTSVLPMNTQDWSPWGWTGWISLQSKGLSRKSLLQHHSWKASIPQC